MLEELLKLSNWVHSPPGAMHFYAALIALVTGPLLFMRRKASGFHRSLGAVYILAMLALNISALTMFDLGGFNLFHFFALLSLSSIVPGTVIIVAAARSRSQNAIIGHGHFMAWSYYGLVMAGIAQIMYRIVPTITGSYDDLNYFWTLAMPATAALTVFLTRRHIPRIAKNYGARQSQADRPG